MAKILLTVVKWLLPKQCTNFFAVRFAHYARRWLIISLYLVFLMLGDGWQTVLRDFKPQVRALATAVFSESATATNAPLPLPGSGESKLAEQHRTWGGILWHYRFEMLSFVWWLVPAVFVAFLITAITDGAVAAQRESLLKELPTLTGQPVVSPDAAQEAQRQAINQLLVVQTGIKSVFPSEVGVAVTNQKYAKEMRDAVESSKHLRLLTIAGFEYIGKGDDSLLYDLIVKNKVDVEVVLLDHKNGSDVMNTRVNELRKRDGYTAKKMRQHIEKTTETLNQLRTDGSKVNLEFTDEHPIFRVLLLDHCLFFSAYLTAAHGHEAPVYQIMRKTGSTSDLSWYFAFERHFVSVQSRARARKKQTGVIAPK